jgi:hypothetical protein
LGRKTIARTTLWFNKGVKKVTKLKIKTFVVLLLEEHEERNWELARGWGRRNKKSFPIDLNLDGNLILYCIVICKL